MGLYEGLCERKVNGEILEERWVEFDFLVRSIDGMYGHGWDEAEPDDGDTRRIIEIKMERNRKTK